MEFGQALFQSFSRQILITPERLQIRKVIDRGPSRLDIAWIHYGTILPGSAPIVKQVALEIGQELGYTDDI